MERVEALLVAAGILHESDIGQDAYSEDEDDDQDEDEDEYWENNNRPTSSGRVSDLSEASEVARFSSGGDFALTPLFKTHESEDSRYFGMYPPPNCGCIAVYAADYICQAAAVHFLSYHGVESSGSRTKLGIPVS